MNTHFFAVCKSAAYRFGGSNPPSPTKKALASASAFLSINDICPAESLRSSQFQLKYSGIAGTIESNKNPHRKRRIDDGQCPDH